MGKKRAGKKKCVLVGIEMAGNDFIIHISFFFSLCLKLYTSFNSYLLQAFSFDKNQ